MSRSSLGERGVSLFWGEGRGPSCHLQSIEDGLQKIEYQLKMTQGGGGGGNHYNRFQSHRDDK